ncbi:ABC transporter ATP-binding protein [Gordonia sp. (in: high G+C Gram-positive bacteria)]|uniref:ABC transporter ATP-binding protein n=1 Tax=Gordonia sp. (in: high G+C Gram-positive bacteria) TaxID=84139 RepID=UPI003F9E4148
MLSVSDATRRIGAQTLFTSLSFTVERGQCAAVVGPNGIGKSSLLRAVVDDELLDEGSILIDGRVPDDRSPEFRRLVVAELGEQAVFYDATVGEHIAMLAASHEVDPDIEVALRRAGIGDLRDRFPHTLSTGQRQRFALVAAFIRPARLVVLDEPERGLDAAGQEWVADELDRVTGDGAAVLVATHSRDLVERCADLVLDLAS